jgi:hypothetical protein
MRPCAVARQATTFVIAVIGSQAARLSTFDITDLSGVNAPLRSWNPQLSSRRDS